MAIGLSEFIVSGAKRPDGTTAEPGSRADLQSAKVSNMKSAIERAVEALEQLPDDLQEREALRLEEQAEKLRVMRRLIQEAEDDVTAGRVSEWNFDAFLAEAQADPSNA